MIYYEWQYVIMSITFTENFLLWVQSVLPVFLVGYLLVGEILVHLLPWYVDINTSITNFIWQQYLSIVCTLVL